jgi:ubiquinone biosynthesis monooxygenase Coq7
LKRPALILVPLIADRSGMRMIMNFLPLATYQRFNVMNDRHLNFADRCISELDNALRVVAARSSARRAAPVAEGDGEMPDTDRALVARLMRVNHTGEIAAQALYRGQALVARDPELRANLLDAADEEHDHLAWCQQRAEDLGGTISKLAPLWYAGSFTIGMAAGLAGDKISLGFLAETEKQVSEHLSGHLQRLPAEDHASRAILEQMRDDEIRHGDGAVAQGGMPLPEAVKNVMRMAAKVMTSVSYRL